MVLELLFEYGERESSSVAQIPNVVQKTTIKKVNVLLTASGELHIPENFLRPTVTWFYYYTLYAHAISQESGRQIDQNTSGRFTLKTNLALSFIDS